MLNDQEEAVVHDKYRPRGKILPPSGQLGFYGVNLPEYLVKFIYRDGYRETRIRDARDNERAISSGQNRRFHYIW